VSSDPADDGPSDDSEADPLLAVEDLERHYTDRSFLGTVRERTRAVDGVSFAIRRGETLGLVGESGCGKSTVARTVLRLDEPTGGEVRFDGQRVADHSRAERRAFRRRTGAVFQDPTASFDPRMRVGRSVAEPLRVHGLAADRRRPVVEDLLERVGLSAEDYDRYPGAFSVGQRQRLALARALTTNPDLLVADEPASALDVSVQAGVLGLLDRLQSELGLSTLLITHDMGIVRQVCDRVAVMYLGEIVEVAPTETLFADPQHPYTEALLGAVPSPDPAERAELVELRGDVPDPADPPEGCRFHTRCPRIIPPDDLDIDRTAFRRVTDLRVALRQEELGVETLRRTVADRTDREPTAVPTDRLADALRESYEIPELRDQAAERAVSAALVAAVEGDRDRARERLSRFASPCEREAPTTVGRADRRVSCHLRDGETIDTPAGAAAPEETESAGADD
jgi:peptide/nickel transport system ATP-binding protein